MLTVETLVDTPTTLPWPIIKRVAVLAYMHHKTFNEMIELIVKQSVDTISI